MACVTILPESFHHQEPDGSSPSDLWAQPVTPEREEDPRYRLDPKRLPRPLDLEISAELADKIDALARRSGRSPDEIVLELIERANRLD